MKLPQKWKKDCITLISKGIRAGLPLEEKKKIAKLLITYLWTTRAFFPVKKTLAVAISPFSFELDCEVSSIGCRWMWIALHQSSQSCFTHEGYHQKKTKNMSILRRIPLSFLFFHHVFFFRVIPWSIRNPKSSLPKPGEKGLLRQVPSS